MKSKILIGKILNDENWFKVRESLANLDRLNDFHISIDSQNSVFGPHLSLKVLDQKKDGKEREIFEFLQQQRKKHEFVTFSLNSKFK